MAEPAPTLDDLRRQIDAIDDQLHDLLMRRTDVVTTIAALKKTDLLPAIRPGREALILRRLVERHDGPFPRAILVRLWREILSATTGLQVNFAVTVHVPDDQPGFWDLARDHFGSHTPMTAYRSAKQVVHAVTEGQATVGVLGMPEEGEADPWWPYLVTQDAQAPRVIARLPFAGRGNARGENGDALAIGHGEAEATGADRSLLAVEMRSDVSRARVLAVLAGAGLEPSFLIPIERKRGGSVNLLELEGMVAPKDAVLVAALEQLGDAVDRVFSLGSYARPIAANAAEAGWRAARPRGPVAPGEAR